MALGNITLTTSTSNGGTTQAPVFESDTPPAVPVIGTPWFNTVTVRTYLYYVDANGSHWVEQG